MRRVSRNISGYIELELLLALLISASSITLFLQTVTITNKGLNILSSLCLAGEQSECAILCGATKDAAILLECATSGRSDAHMFVLAARRGTQ